MNERPNKAVKRRSGPLYWSKDHAGQDSPNNQCLKGHHREGVLLTLPAEARRPQPQRGDLPWEARIPRGNANVTAPADSSDDQAQERQVLGLGQSGHGPLNSPSLKRIGAHALQYPREDCDLARRHEMDEAQEPRPEARPSIRLLADNELAVMLPLIEILNPDTPRTVLAQRLAEMRENGYRCAGAFVDRQCVGVAGMWFGTRFWCGRYVDIDNVVVDPSWRSHGIGQALLDWVEDYARRQGCEKAVLDAYVINDRAHAFYMRRGYRIIGFHFDKDLKEPEDAKKKGHSDAQ